MARSSPSVPVPDLLAAVSDRCRASDARDNAERDAAAARCWLAIQRLADGDLTGGADPAKFAADLDACNMTLADVRTVLAEIASCRKAQADHDLAVAAVATAADEANAAVAARDSAKASLDAAEIRRTRSLNAHADAGEALTRAATALAAARAAETSLRGRGFTGSPIVTTAPPAAPRPRRWRILKDLVPVGNRLLLRNSVVLLDPSVVLAERDGEPCGDDEPLVVHLPRAGEPGGPCLVDNGDVMRSRGAAR